MKYLLQLTAAKIKVAYIPIRDQWIRSNNMAIYTSEKASFA